MRPMSKACLCHALHPQTLNLIHVIPKRSFYNCLGISGNAQAIEEMLIYNDQVGSGGQGQGHGVEPPIRA
jgi:hypothetical protein